LEPEHKKSWISLSSVAVNVQIFHDPLKNIYRIVSIEGTKALINSIVTAKMTFTKTSQKFGQWIDFKLNLVYGLGFANDTELNKFVEKFKEIKEYTRSHQKTHERSNSCEISSSVNRHIIDQNVTLFFLNLWPTGHLFTTIVRMEFFLERVFFK
jgi:homer protein